MILTYDQKAMRIRKNGTKIMTKIMQNWQLLRINVKETNKLMPKKTFKFQFVNIWRTLKINALIT